MRRSAKIGEPVREIRQRYVDTNAIAHRATCLEACRERVALAIGKTQYSFPVLEDFSASECSPIDRDRYRQPFLREKSNLLG